MWKKIIILALVLVVCTGARWKTVCRHRAVFAGYTVSERFQERPQKVRIAVGIIYDSKTWKATEIHARAQAYSEDFDEWHWLCVSEKMEVFTCMLPDVNFVVKHYITLDEAFRGEWKTEDFEKYFE